MWKVTLLLFFSVTRLSSQAWSRLPDFPGTQRDDGVAALVNNKVYFGTGLQDWWIPSRDFFVLNLGNYMWDTIRPMPQGDERQYALSFIGNNCFYVFGGDESGALNDLFKYDITTNTWTKMASKPGNGLMGASCMQFGDKVIITGGKIAQQGPVSAEVWEYNLGNDVWTQKNNFPFLKTTRGSAAVLNVRGYMMFGLDDSSRYTNHMYEYHPSDDAWFQLPDFPHGEGRAYCALESSSQKLVLFAGHSENNVYHKDVWYFADTISGWKPGPEFPALPRRSTMACLAGDRLIFSCGLGQGDVRLKETWMLDVPLGVLEKTRSNAFTIFPQPANNIININSGDIKIEKIRIVDLSGRLVLEQPLTQDQTVDIRKLTSGFYLLEIWENEKLLGSKKIIRN